MGRQSKVFGIPAAHKGKSKFVKRLDTTSGDVDSTTANSMEDRFAEGRIASEIDGEVVNLTRISMLIS